MQTHTNTEAKNTIIANLFMIFIMFQPLLDLSTSFTKVVLNSSFTPGMLIRAIFIILGFFYILYESRKKENRKFLWYMVVLAIFFILNLGISYLNKPQFSLFTELVSIAKTVYFIEMFFVFILSFKELKNNQNINRFYPINIVISQVIISVSMLIAEITGTSIDSYDGVLKSGNSGWFFAANEVGTLASICFPILIWASLRNKKLKNKLLLWTVVIGTIYTLISIGTKVGYLAVVITLFMAMLSFFGEFIISKFKDTNRPNIVNVMLVAITFVIVLLGTPYMPVTQNTNSHVRYIEETEEIEGNAQVKDPKPIKLVPQVIYSGRQEFVEGHAAQFKVANFWQKSFGMGFAGNYLNFAKVIERDFHDIFYQYGGIGMFLIFFPMGYYSLQLVNLAFKHFLDLFNLKYILTVTGLLLGFGISFIAGHTLLAPAVSTYLTIIFSYLVVDLDLEKSVRI